MQRGQSPVLRHREGRGEVPSGRGSGAATIWSTAGSETEVGRRRSVREGAGEGKRWLKAMGGKEKLQPERVDSHCIKGFPTGLFLFPFLELFPDPFQIKKPYQMLVAFLFFFLRLLLLA